MSAIVSTVHSHESASTQSVAGNSFPGPLVTGVAMIAGPLLAIVGLALSIGIYKFKGADMISAMAAHHVRAGFAINISVASMVVLLIAVIALAHSITEGAPRWGRWGGVVTIIGLMGPIFFEGIFWGSYQITASAYQAAGAHLIDHANVIPSNVINVSAPCIVIGWIILGIGAYKAGVLPKWRAVCLGLGCLLAPALAAAIVPLGIIAGVLLALALVPLGAQTLAARRI